MTPIEQLEVRLTDARRLLEIHKQMTGDKAGRRRNVDILNRSSMLLTVAAWEEFAEDTALVHATKLSRNMKDPSALPPSVISSFMFWYFDDNQMSKPSNTTKIAMWDLAGDGWRAAYRRYVTQKVDDLNTPNYFRIKKLFSQTVGIEDIGSNWKHGRHGKAHYVAKLSEALNIRHEIAHGRRGDVTVGKGTAQSAIALIERLAVWITASISMNEHALLIEPEDATAPT